MSSCRASRIECDSTSVAFDRLRRTVTFRDERLKAWSGSKIAIFGAGALGGPLAREAVRSGTEVFIFDPDFGSPENLATQIAELGVLKVDTVAEACNAIWPGRAHPFPIALQHAGVGLLSRMNLLIDCTDDASLAWPITQISNGLGIDLLRCAVDGTGELEMGRVSFSGGGVGHACQLCNYGWHDIFGPKRRTPCPGYARATSNPTLAGSAISMAIAGYTLLQGQRLITGNDRDQVVNREILLDLSHGQLFNMQLNRSDSCLSGHVRWDLFRPGTPTSESTLSTVFDIGKEHFGTARVTVEPFLHPIQINATCKCGEPRKALGTPWSAPPQCPQCGQQMVWQRETEIDRLLLFDAKEFGILDTPLQDLGFPTEGGMFVIRAEGAKPLRLVLD